MSEKIRFVEKTELELSALTEHERRLYNKKKSYWKNKDAILVKMKEKYDLEKEARLNAGILPGKRGRKKKYLSDEEIQRIRELPGIPVVCRTTPA
jgi:hypothetical protein